MLANPVPHASVPKAASASPTTCYDNIPTAPTCVNDNLSYKPKRTKTGKTTFCHKRLDHEHNVGEHELSHRKSREKTLFLPIHNMLNDTSGMEQAPKTLGSTQMKFKENPTNFNTKDQKSTSDDFDEIANKNNLNWALNNFLSDTDPILMLCPYNLEWISQETTKKIPCNKNTYYETDNLNSNESIYHYIHSNYSKDNMYISRQYQFNECTYHQDDDYIPSPPGSTDYSWDVALEADFDSDVDFDNSSNISTNISTKSNFSSSFLSTSSSMSISISTDEVQEKAQALPSSPMLTEAMFSSPLYHDMFTYLSPSESSLIPPATKTKLFSLNYNSYKQNLAHQNDLRTLEKDIEVLDVQGI
ncbi:hypothetical protein NADFUDRAFT_39551 [Nadsonia fulvescens var. elongata DSM 6958]|uniref:Uncharacterized protein n=1 Tax=Nadsonia fulvescens var. elongata DSM 6958 TaxID=857566 RepID=A0A1E3PRU4_9ASCO|nr:hypothetical protein NADFUDRAFT_39551 [Nadsonia fulvescens var. elongata DSM 6958]